MSSKKPDKAAELATRMIEALEARRGFGGASDPPTLLELGEMCDGAASHDQIIKAATKKAFTDRAVVDKVDKKPSLNSPVYFKGDRPKDEERLARRMASVLESQRKLGGDAYPPTLRRLAELCETKGPENLIRKAAAFGPMGERTLVAARSGKTMVLDAPIVFRQDVDGESGVILEGLLRFALSPVVSKTKKGTSETTAFTPAEIVKRLIPELRDRVEASVMQGVARQEMPVGVGRVMLRGKPLLFLTSNIGNRSRPSQAADGHTQHPHRYTEPSASSHGSFAPGDFVQAFRAAFEILDRRNGSTNFVKLADLRDALSEFSREDFDDGLRRLRMEGIFSLDSHEGQHGSLSDDERQAGVRESGSLLVYASRR